MESTEIDRKDMYGWEIAQTADNNVQLLQYEKRMKVHNFEATALPAQKVAAITVKFEQSDWTHISLRAHEVTVIISTPTGKWFLAKQESFAKAISELLGLNSFQLYKSL